MSMSPPANAPLIARNRLGQRATQVLVVLGILIATIAIGLVIIRNWLGASP